MRLAIPMAFSKRTKRKAVFATDDGLAPISTVYVATEDLRSRGIDTRRIIVTVSDVPFTEDEAGQMLLSMPLRALRTTKYKTVFVNADAPVDSLYVVSEWLHTHGFGDILYLGISDAASVNTAEDERDGTDAANESEELSPDDAFEALLEEAVVRRKGNRLTTAQIRAVWADRRGADPDDDVIGGIHKQSVARRFRAHFSAPPGTRGRVNGKVEYYWDGYAVVVEGAV